MLDYPIFSVTVIRFNMTDFRQVESCIASGMWLAIKRLFALRTGIILPNARLLSCLMMVGLFYKKIQDYTGHHTVIQWVAKVQLVTALCLS